MSSLTIEAPEGAEIHQFSVVIPIEAEAIKRDALALCKAIAGVPASDAELAKAVEAVKKTKQIISEVDKTRKAIIAPFKAIIDDARAKELQFVNELETERDRVTGLANHYEQLKQRAAREAQEKIERETREAKQREEAAQREVERLKREAEIATGAGKIELEKKALAASLAAEDAALDAPSTVAVIPAKVAGYSAKEIIDFECVEPFAFATAYPEFWSKQDDNETLKIKRREILEELNKFPNRFTTTPYPDELPEKPGAFPHPPGLRIYHRIRSRI